MYVIARSLRWLNFRPNLSAGLRFIIIICTSRSRRCAIRSRILTKKSRTLFYYLSSIIVPVFVHLVYTKEKPHILLRKWLDAILIFSPLLHSDITMCTCICCQLLHYIYLKKIIFFYQNDVDAWASWAYMKATPLEGTSHLVICNIYMTKILINNKQKRCHRHRYVEQDLLTLLEHVRSPPILGVVCVDQSSVFSVVFCVPLFFCRSFFFFSHGVVSLWV